MTKKEIAISTFIVGINCVALPIFIGFMRGVSEAYDNGILNDGLELAVTGAVEIFKENAAIISGISGCVLMAVGSRLNR